ncbi:MAG: FAD-dependent oxidoreductase [Burkholderiaceae bacterium]
MTQSDLSEVAGPYDIIIVGSGAGGLSAAVVAAHNQLRVLVVEKAATIGGTTARSGGWLWIPSNRYQVQAGMSDSRQEALDYLKHETGAFFDADRIDSYLSNGPAMVDWFVDNTALEFALGPSFADYHCNAVGGKPGGRSIVALPYDGRELAGNIRHLRPPLPELTLLGLMIGSGEELWHFFNATRSPRSMWHVVKLCASYTRDRLVHGRGMRLTNGNALAARLYRSALDAGVNFISSASVTELIRASGESNAVTGVVITSGEKTVEITASKAVILAAGGFPHDIERRKALFAHAPTGKEHTSPAPETNTGDGLRLGESAGARVTSELPNAAAWVPVSVVPRKDGSTGVFPHFVDRSKPGVIAVNRTGQRFVNEADSYHDFIQALVASLKSEPTSGEICAWFIADHKTVRRYGLGFAKGSPLPLGPYVRSGYLIRGSTLTELAERAGIEPNNFVRTVEQFNGPARTGDDPAFGRGSSAYNRSLGDPGHQPNPCVAPLEQGPFYAVKVVPGDLGTFAGLQTDRYSRVIDQGSGTPISGLYACGNDAASVMGGNYPGGGITLGPAMTFGYVAARHIAGLDTETAQGTSNKSEDSENCGNEQEAANRVGASALVSAFEMRRLDPDG